MRNYLIIFLVMGLIFGNISMVKAADSVKIAYVDIEKVFEAYDKKQEQNKLLEDEGSKKSAEREKKVEEIKKLQQDLEMLSDDAKREKEDLIEEKLSALQLFDRKATNELKKKMQDARNDILKDIERIVKNYAYSKKYNLILDSRMVLYGNEALNVSNEIIDQLNAEYNKNKK